MNMSTANSSCAALPTNDDGKENNNNTILPGPQQATVFMRQSLEELNSALTCHLCHQMLNDPSTLACAHTFCWKCIESFSAKNSLCPLKGCGMPLSVTGSRQGGFLKTNPSIETVLSSFQTICQALEDAPQQWWQHGKEENNDDDNHDDDDINDDTESNSHHSGSDSDAEMIILNTESPPRTASQHSQDDSTQDADEIAAINDPSWMNILAEHSDDDDDDDEDDDESNGE